MEMGHSNQNMIKYRRISTGRLYRTPLKRYNLISLRRGGSSNAHNAWLGSCVSITQKAVQYHRNPFKIAGGGIHRLANVWLTFSTRCEESQIESFSPNRCYY